MTRVIQRRVSFGAVLPALAVTLLPPLAFAAGPHITPLYPPGTPVTEDIQYTDTNGSLVTRMGLRPIGRHSREPWNNTQQQQGSYYTYPAFYFQNRTYGLEIHDHLPAGGNSIDFDLVVNFGEFDGTTFSLFRDYSDPHVLGYGWSANHGFENPTQDNNNFCFAGQPVANCQQTTDSNWSTNPHSPLTLGEPIELAPAEFLLAAPGTFIAAIDGGGIRYYATENLYVTGKGVAPWYGVAPRLNSSPLPADTLLGGGTTISYDYSSEPMRTFNQMATNIGITDAQLFVQGRHLFHISYLTGLDVELPDNNPVFTQHIGQLGPRYNQQVCELCHTNDGRSPVTNVGSRLDTMTVLTAASGPGGTLLPDPTYGTNIQQDAQSANAPDYGVTIASYSFSTRMLADGTAVSLRQPAYNFAGPVPQLYSVRQAPQIIGLGLLEAVPEGEILGFAKENAAHADGILGVANVVTNPETGQTQLGRFGWKAAKASLRTQSAAALIQDIGVTSPVFPTLSCQADPAQCVPNESAGQVSSGELQNIAQYLSLLGVPAQRKLLSGYGRGIYVPPYHQVSPAAIADGAKVFAAANCSGCHRPTLTTGNTHPQAELRNQTFHPYTDLLVHDMGPGLADTLPEGLAQPSMWRTQPLWGLGYLPYVQANTFAGDPTTVGYLHDGRARNLLEAIEWHDGEAAPSRQAFESLSTVDRNNLLAFLNSL